MEKMELPEKSSCKKNLCCVCVVVGPSFAESRERRVAAVRGPGQPEAGHCPAILQKLQCYRVSQKRRPIGKIFKVDMFCYFAFLIIE